MLKLRCPFWLKNTPWMKRWISTHNFPVLFSFLSTKTNLEKVGCLGLLLWAGQSNLAAFECCIFPQIPLGGHEALLCKVSNVFFLPRLPRYMVNVQHNLCYKTWRRKMPNVWRTRGTRSNSRVVGKTPWEKPYPNRTPKNWLFFVIFFWE